MSVSLSLSESDTDTADLFASPSSAGTKAANQPTQKAPSPPPIDSKTNFDDARETALRRELVGIRSINEVIAGVVDSLAQAKGNMDTISRTVTNASTLLNIWMRILSQTEHNQRLVLNASWRGATQDLSDMENERIQRRQEKERKLMEEVHKRGSAMRKAAEDEKRRDETASGRNSRGTNSRGRGTGHAATGGQSLRGIRRGGSTVPGRASSGIGRGFSDRNRGANALS